MDPVLVSGIPLTVEQAILDAGVTADTIIAAKPFKEWLAAMDRDRFKIRSIHIQSVDMFGSRVGFLKFKADVVDQNDRFLPGIVFMRGGAVGILPVLVSNGERYAVLTVQPRFPTGQFAFVEIPAGMLDGSGNFSGVAAKELEEELKIKVSTDELIDLTEFAGYPGGYYPSCGGSDETIRLFSFTRTVSAEELADINGRLTGLLDEGEQITLKVVPLDEVWKVPDGKAITAYALFCQYEASLKPAS